MESRACRHLKAVPDFNLEQELAAATEFVVEAVVPAGTKNAPKAEARVDGPRGIDRHGAEFARRRGCRTRRTRRRVSPILRRLYPQPPGSGIPLLALR